MGLFCKKCGHGLNANARFCPMCGTEISTQMLSTIQEDEKQEVKQEADATSTAATSTIKENEEQGGKLRTVVDLTKCLLIYTSILVIAIFVLVGIRAHMTNSSTDQAAGAEQKKWNSIGDILANTPFETQAMKEKREARERKKKELERRKIDLERRENILETKVKAYNQIMDRKRGNNEYTDRFNQVKGAFNMSRGQRALVLEQCRSHSEDMLNFLTQFELPPEAGEDWKTALENEKMLARLDIQSATAAMKILEGQGINFYALGQMAGSVNEHNRIIDQNNTIWNGISSHIDDERMSIERERITIEKEELALEKEK